MPENPDIKKVLVLGSGPIIIGQAVEFDYAGTQACRSLKEEGIEVVLPNSNPATIMTDKDIADRVYIEPPTVEVVKQFILEEKPDSVLPTLGGQAGPNPTMELEDTGFFKEHDVRLIGTTALTIKKAEDREMFKEITEKIGEPVAPSDIVEDVKHGLETAEKIGHPAVPRPAYTPGDSGGDIAANPEQCVGVLENRLCLSRVGQVSVERCIAGWKEIEYEVMRDGAGNVITVCNMENIDLVGVHTGDSIVVAPPQTLGDKEYQMLRTSALNIISELGVAGGCNVQYVLNPDSFEYCAVEVNPRVGRSSVLVSRATGYPIVKVAAKTALGYTLDEIRNAVTKKTYVSFEPMLDYYAVKMPRLPSDKLTSVRCTPGIQMKVIGEVMSTCTNFEGALMEAIRSLEQHVDYLLSYDFTDLSDEILEEGLNRADDMCIWRIVGVLRRGFIYEQIHDVTKTDFWFIDKLAILVEMEDVLKVVGSGEKSLMAEFLAEAKRIEHPDNVIIRLTGTPQEDIKKLRYDNGIRAVYKMVDTCTAEFVVEIPYYYSYFGGFNEVGQTTGRRKVLVLGSGPIRIGQGIEFDFCSVHSTQAFSREDYETIIINNNPETVSTDFDIADKPYFGPLTSEGVESIADTEKLDGVVVQLGGQTAIKLTEVLMKIGVPILDTAAEDVDATEDRERFDVILEQCNIPRPVGHTVFMAEGVKEAAHKLRCPVLVRSSYVLDGQDMQIVISDEDIDEFTGIINQIAQECPILVDKYIMGKEVEVDAIYDGTDIPTPDIIQHIKHTGIHFGDGISVYPVQDITQHDIDTIVDYAEKLARALHVKGVINIQLIADGDDVYIIKANPRSSRTVPYINKATGIPIMPLVTRIICGHTIRKLGYKPGPQPAVDYTAIKMPVFSFEKIRGADISLGPEMKSIGECLGIAKTFNEAFYKTFEGTEIRLPKYKKIIMSVRHSDQEETADIVRRFVAMGYQIFTTRGTARILNKNGVKAYEIHKPEQESPNILGLVLEHQIDPTIDIPAQGAERSHDGFIVYRNAIETGVNALTPLDMANAPVTSLENRVKELTLTDIAMVKNA